MEVENRFYFIFTGVREKKKFSGGKNQTFELKNIFFRNKFNFHDR